MAIYNVHASRLYAVCGPPRTGSMVTFNLVRALASEAGYRVLPETVPPTETDQLAAVSDHVCADDEILTVKLHREIRLADAGGIILNLRDMRDSVCSYIRFTGCDFETALAEVPEWIRLSNHFASTADLVIRFEDLQHSLPCVIADIAALLDVTVDITSASEQFTIAEVEKHVNAIDSSVVVYKHGKGRKYDEKTGFQEGHVYGATDWRKELNDYQQAILTETCADWLNANGYRYRL